MLRFRLRVLRFRPKSFVLDSGTPQTRQDVFDYYFQSITELNRPLLVLGNAFPHTKCLVVDNLYVVGEF